MRVNQGQELVIGGYTPSDKHLRCTYHRLLRERQTTLRRTDPDGLTTAGRAQLFKKLQTQECPFRNIPEIEVGEGKQD